MSYFVAPEKGLTIAFFQGGEATGCPERLPDVADGSLHSPFLISRADRAGSGQEMVVSTEFEKSRMEEDLVAMTLQHNRLHIVIQSDARHAGPGLKRMDMSAQKVFHRLIEEKLQIQST